MLGSNYSFYLTWQYQQYAEVGFWRLSIDSGDESRDSYVNRSFPPPTLRLVLAAVNNKSLRTVILSFFNFFFQLCEINLECEGVLPEKKP